MTKWLSVLVGILVIAVIGQGLWIWDLDNSIGSAGIEVHATNAGVELDSGDARVSVHPAGRMHDLEATGALEQRLSVAPGTYDIQVTFTQASDMQTRWLRGVKLDAGKQVVQSVEFDSGELRVDVLGDSAGKPVLVYVFNQGQHNHVVTSVPAGETALIAPGVYDLRVVLTEASKEKDIRWHSNVPVKSGLQTRVRVPFQRGSLLVRAVNGNRALPEGSVELAIYRAGDQHLNLLDSGIAGVPLHLTAGRYDISATFSASHDRPVRWLRGVEIKTDHELEKVVEFESGTVAVSAQLKDGATLDRFSAYVYFYPAGNHQEPVAYTTAPDPAVLNSGHYDVRVNFFRSHDRPDIWLRNLEVLAGQRLEPTVLFPSGRLLIRAFDEAGNELIGDNVFVYVYPAGVRARPSTVARSGQIITLTSGNYDVHAVDTRQTGVSSWIENITVQSGSLVEQTVEQPTARP